MFAKISLNALSKKWTAIVLIFLSMGLLIHGIVVLKHFHFLVTDNDQAIQWLACHDFSNLNFYTPFLYGNSYGSHFEALLAIPFYKSGIPLYYALPISSHFWISLLLLALFYKLYKANKPFIAVGMAIMLLLLPSLFWVQLFAAKGLTTGILLALCAHIILIGKPQTTIKLISCGLLMGLGFAFNPNCFFLILMAGYWIKNFRQIIFIAGSALASFTLYSVAVNFTRSTIETSEIHRQWSMDFSASQWLEKIQITDSYLNFFTPTNGLGYLSFILPIVLLLFISKRPLKIITTTAYLIIIVASFGINKVGDGTHDILFSISRFYIAIGFVNALLFGLILNELFHKHNKLQVPVLASLMIIVSVFLTGLVTELKRNERESGQLYAVKKVYISQMLKNVETLQNIIKKEKKGPLIITTGFPLYTENIYLKTLEPKDITVAFHNSNMFYWMKNELEQNKKPFDLIMITPYPDLFEKNRIRFSEFYYDDFEIPYFLERNTHNWMKQKKKYFNE